MKKIDFSNYKFRASGIKNLMTRSRKKTDPLSETTKSYLQEIWIEEVFGRRKPVITAPMQKGTMVESNSLDLVQKVSGDKYFKNVKSLENDFIKGTPDVIGDNFIIDIKSSWDLWTFAKVDLNSATKAYYYQILAYMWLTDTKKGSLVYALVNTPEELMASEFQRLSWKLEQEKAEEVVRRNHTFDDIDPKIRIRKFDYEFSQTDIEEVTKKIELCRQYLQEFSL